MNKTQNVEKSFAEVENLVGKFIEVEYTLLQTKQAIKGMIVSITITAKGNMIQIMDSKEETSWVEANNIIRYRIYEPTWWLEASKVKLI